jgi:hypothetical protein
MKLATRLVGVALLSCAACVAHASVTMDDLATAKAKYETFKTRVVSGDLEVDWQAFRLAAMASGVNGSFDWQKQRNEVFQDLDAQKNAEALAGARRIIDHNMANPEGHLLAMAALQRLGKDEYSKNERSIVTAITKSITDSGDGKSPATAWVTVDPSEEYFLISTIFGAQPKSQALVKQDGHAYDRMTITDQDNKEQVLWFNTDASMEAMASALHPKQPLKN